MAQESKVDGTGKFLTFSLKEQHFGVTIGSIREINQMSPITAVPKTPAHVVGVINLRGKVIPVVDLRLKFGIEATAYTRRSCIVVTEGEQGWVGVIVDAVNEVVEFPADQVEPPPDMGARVGAPGGRESADFIIGMGKTESRVIVLVDIAKALAQDGITEIAASASRTQAVPPADVKTAA